MEQNQLCKAELNAYIKQTIALPLTMPPTKCTKFASCSVSAPSGNFKKSQPEKNILVGWSIELWGLKHPRYYVTSNTYWHFLNTLFHSTAPLSLDQSGGLTN